MATDEHAGLYANETLAILGDAHALLERTTSSTFPATTAALGSWPAADCPLCRAGVPVNTQYAHGRKYIARPSEQR